MFRQTNQPLAKAVSANNSENVGAKTFLLLFLSLWTIT